MTIYKTKGYELTRKSDKKVFTHAVIFVNHGTRGGSIDLTPEATFHVSLKLAEAEMKRMSKISWLIAQEIIEVEAVA